MVVVLSTINNVVGEIVDVFKYHACCVCAKKSYLMVKHPTAKCAR